MGKIKIIVCLIKFTYLQCLQRAFILLQIRTACYGCYDEIITVLSTPGGGHSQPETEESRKSCNFAPKENSLNSAALSPPNFKRVRRCNWTRFLSLETDNLNIRANLKCTKNEAKWSNHRLDSALSWSFASSFKLSSSPCLSWFPPKNICFQCRETCQPSLRHQRTLFCVVALIAS